MCGSQLLLASSCYNRQCEPCTPSCPSPSLRMGPSPCLNHAGFCQLLKVFPIPHHCTKAGQLHAASCISGTGSLYIFILGPPDPSAMQCGMGEGMCKDGN